MSSTGRRTTVVDVDIERIAFVPVDGSNVGDIRGDAGVQTGNEIPDILTQHIEEIAIKQDTVKVTHGMYDDSENRVRDVLEKLLTTTADDTFLDLTLELARRLNDQMPGTATEGTLVVSKASLGGQNITNSPIEVVVLLKLDGERMERPTVSSNRMSEISEENVLPDRERIQKGAIYPGKNVPPRRQNGDVKIYEQSGTEYFSIFLEYSSGIKSTYEQARSAIEVSNDLVESRLGRELNEDDYSIIRSSSESDGSINVDTMTQALDEISDGAIESEEVLETFANAGVANLTTNSDSIPAMARRELSTAQGDVTVKYPVSTSGSITEDGGRLVIEFDDMDKRYVQH